jgi:anthranilate phosphoribosyltransferase
MTSPASSTTPTLGIREALAQVVAGRNLSVADMSAVVGCMMDGQATPAQMGSLLTALRMKGETVDEVVGAASAMRQRMVRVSSDEPVLLDTCGTGGDGSGTVNISTLASFIVAACGVKVAKHGNRALSSRSGSHDVIEAMGIDPGPTPETAQRCLAEVGLCFMFAPVFHAATRHVAGPRRELGFRTLFNLLGPLTNPAGARYHVNGVFAAERCEFMARAHAQLGSLRALVVHGAGGLDEIAPAGATQVAELRDGTVRCYEIRPADFDLPEQDPAGLAGGDAATNARLLEAALAGAPGAIRVAALLAAAAGLYVVGAAPDLRAGARQAAAALDNGGARAVVEHLRRLSPVQKKE